MDLNKLCPGCMEDDSGDPICPKCGRPFDLVPKNSLQMKPRTMLRDQYFMGRALGHGGFGITYLAWDVGLETRLAIKEYMPNGVAGRASNETRVLAFSDQTQVEFEYGLERFLEEARVLKKFRDHPNIVSIDTIFRENGTAYLVMEYLDGMTFEEFLKRRGGRITVETALRVMLPVMDALAAVHSEGILHRDISPDNIHLARNGKVKLIDFGAARNALGQKSRNLSIILKEGYAPEEQYRASGIQGPWTDVYATAATLYHAITGQVPQPSLDRQAEDQLLRPSQMDVPIDPAAEAALMKALAVRAPDRFQSMEDFKAALGGGFEVPAAATRKVDRNDPRIRELEQAALMQAQSAPPALPHPPQLPRQPSPQPSMLAAQFIPPPPPPFRPQTGAPVTGQPAYRPPANGKSAWLWPVALGGAAVTAVVVVMLMRTPVDDHKGKDQDKKGVVDGGTGSDKGGAFNGGGGSDVNHGGDQGGPDKGGAGGGDKSGNAGGDTAHNGGSSNQRDGGGGGGGNPHSSDGGGRTDGGNGGGNTSANNGGNTTANGGGNGAGNTTANGGGNGDGRASDGGRGRGNEPPPASETYEGLVQAALKASQQNGYAQAEQLLSRAVAMEPNRPQAYDKLAEVQMYFLNQIGPALQNYQAAIAHGGTATFHVAHDHSTGNFTTNCKGWLYVSKSQVKYQAFDSIHAFNVPRSQVREFKKNRYTINLSNRAAVDLKAFHVKLADGKNYNFAPGSRFGEAERDLILSIGGVE